MKIFQTIKNSISTKTAILSFLGLFLFGIFYHILILTRVVDYRFAWGGRLTSLEQMYKFEAVSVILQIVLTAIVVTKHKATTNSLTFKITRVLVFMISALFLLNTLGNILAVSWFEKLVFTPITLWSSIATLKIALDD